MIYGTTRESFDHDLGLANQIERASVSVMANIAEGFEAQSKRKFISYLQIANGSTAEVKSHLHVALDQDYIGEAEFERIYSQATTVGKLIGGFISYLKGHL